MAGLQIMGLVSGLDVDEAIKHLLEVERLPLTRMAVRKDTYKVQQDAWRDINTRLSALDNNLTALRLGSTFQSREALPVDPEVVAAEANLAAVPGVYEVAITHRALAHRVASTDAIAGDYKTSGDAMLHITVGTGEEAMTAVQIAAGSDLKKIAQTINDAKASVQATIIGGRLVLESAATGTEHGIALNDQGTGLLSELQLTTGDHGELNTIQAARDAEFSVNGIALTSQSNTIEDAVEGLKFTLLADNSTTRVTVKLDTDHAIAKVKAFVDQYNSVMGFIGEKVKVTMTDDGKVSATGTLQGDGTANRLRDALRHQATSPLAGDGESTYNQLAVLGITTNREGMLQIDEDKLRAALTENPQAVTAFFDEKATNMKGFIDGYIKYGDGVLAEKQDSIGRLIKNVDQQMERLEERVARKEESLIKQFTALEKALSGIYAQGDWLAQQLDMLSAWTMPQRRR